MDAFDRLVLVNRYNEPEPLKLSLPLGQLLDKAWCTQMSRSVMTQFEWTICEATNSLADQLPEKSGLYMFVWRIPFPFPSTKLGKHFFRMIVYIGQAGAQNSGNTLQQRYRQEYASIVGQNPDAIWQTESPTRKDRLKRALNLRDLEFWYHDSVPGTSLLLEFERTLIDLFRPTANTQGIGTQDAPRLQAKLGHAIPAF